MREPSTDRSGSPATGLSRVSAAMVSHDAGLRSCPPCQLGHDHPVVKLLIVVSGRMELIVDERRISVGMGSGVFVGGETPFSYIAPGEISYISADFSAEGPGFQNVLPEPLVPLGAPSLIAATSAFVAHAFASMDVPRPPATPMAGARAKVLAYIAAHHSEADLSVATLAARLGLSTRTLERLFAGQEKGVANEIAAARLHHALTLLQDPQTSHASLEEIAAWSGFSTLAKMRRTVQAATGRSPREHRA